MKTSFVTKIITFVGVLVVLFYFGYSILSYLADPLTTTVAYHYRSEEAVTVSGYLVREEVVIPGGDGLVHVTRGEGERVSAGGKVAVHYNSQAELEQARELERLEEQLEQLIFARDVASGSQQVLRLDGDIMDGIFAIRSSVAANDLTHIGDRSDSMRAMILKRDYTYSGVGGEQLQQQIDSLESRIKSLQAATKGSTRINSKEAGYFSVLVDGYESALTPDLLEGITPSALKSIRSTGDTSGVGKVVRGSRWYYAAVMDTEDMGKLAVGDTVTLRFVSTLERDFQMEVDAISREENGQKVVVLSSDRYLALTTLLRQQNAQMIFHAYNGIRVPKSALRVVTDTVELEDGTEKQINTTGVYCRMGLVARLKPVKVLFQGEDYYLVEPETSSLDGMAAAQRESRILRGGDEVIVSANALYDGKVIDEQ